VVADRFRVEKVIGDGGMGAVVAAQHIEIGNKVAIKFLHPHLAKDSDVLERFMREAKVGTKIKSEHVVRVIDVGKTPSNLPYIVMELLEGADLNRMVGSGGKMELQLALDCVLQAAEALAEAHAQGIVHRDIKPANLWLSRRADGSPCVKVLDFGISKLMGERAAAGITSTKASFGSPAYMSPEQIRSAKHVDFRTDVWALGVVLFELLTGALPFDADNVAGILAAIGLDPPTRLSRLRPDIQPEVELAILRTLEKDPNQRSTLADFARALRPFAGPAGQISADRIERVAQPIPSMQPPPPISSADLVALGKTEPSGVGITAVQASKKPLVLGVLVGAAVAVLGSSTGIYFVTRHPAQPGPSASVVVSAEPVPQPSAAPVVAVPSEAPVASAAISPPPRTPFTGRRRPAPAPTPATAPVAAPASSISEGRN
jgi:serine/threonine-protein kinase